MKTLEILYVMRDYIKIYQMAGTIVINNSS